MSESYKGKDWFVLEGSISHFQWSEGHENLLEQIQNRARVKNTAAGAAAAALNMYGTLATSAMIAMYDGEYTENFACAVNGKVVCGTFCGARKLQNGDRVKMVVSPIDNGVLYAHAVQRPKDELLWMPSQVHCGDRAALKDAIKMAKNTCIFGWVFFSIFGLIGPLFGGWGWLAAFYLCIGSAFVMPIVAFGGEFLPGRAGKEFGEIGSKIFTLLEFSDPDNLNILEAGMGFQSEEPQVNNIYMYRLALDAHANGTKIITRYDRNIAKYKQEAKEKKRQQQSKNKAT